ncbi:MAG: two-component system sensor histidine kinase [Phycisphaerales bacterium]|nr:two-component system sensor histidine kinase [Phycisphaerales bacterium]
MTAAAVPTSASQAQRVEELGQIILAYSEVTDRLQISHDELKTKVIQLQTELGEKNRELERRNRLAALGEMAAGLAHEIRNPLGGIQLYASLLAQDVADRPDSVNTVRKIVSGVKRLEALVSQVLNFSREIRADLEECDMAELIRDAVDVAQAKAQAHGVSVTLHAPASMMRTADGRLLTQAALNLTLNAIEAGGEHVDVTLTEEAGRMSLIIEDDGPGIPADLLDRIFNPFFTTKDDGTGLGLSIVHRIVEAHGGAISATNRPQGGARFELRI